MKIGNFSSQCKCSQENLSSNSLILVLHCKGLCKHFPFPVLAGANKVSHFYHFISDIPGWSWHFLLFTCGDEEYDDAWYNLVPLRWFLLRHQQFYSLLPLHQKCKQQPSEGGKQCLKCYSEGGFDLSAPSIRSLGEPAGMWTTLWEPFWLRKIQRRFGACKMALVPESQDLGVMWTWLSWHGTKRSWVGLWPLEARYLAHQRWWLLAASQSWVRKEVRCWLVSLS